MNKKIITFLVIAVLAIIGITMLVKNPNPKTESTSIPSSATDKTYALVDVQSHNGASSCWIIVNTGVYDVTSFINQHPGGSEAILSLCGKDGTAAFEAQHGGQRRPESELTSLKIGTYKQ